MRDRRVHDGAISAFTMGGIPHKVAATPELVSWVLGFGGGLTIVRPGELQEAVRTAAEQILNKM
jgi:predicted DNA-binding transcriptional regulator YafY